MVNVREALGGLIGNNRQKEEPAQQAAAFTLPAEIRVLIDACGGARQQVADAQAHHAFEQERLQELNSRLASSKQNIAARLRDIAASDSEVPDSLVRDQSALLKLELQIRVQGERVQAATASLDQRKEQLNQSVAQMRAAWRSLKLRRIAEARERIRTAGVMLRKAYAEQIVWIYASPGIETNSGELPGAAPAYVEDAEATGPGRCLVDYKYLWEIRNSTLFTGTLREDIGRCWAEVENAAVEAVSHQGEAGTL